MKVDWTSIWTWIGVTSLAGLITFLLNIGKVFSGVRKAWQWFYLRVTRYRPRVPKETLRLIPRPHQSWWSMGTSDGEPSMQIVCDWYVTNITNQAVKVCGARVRKPKVDGHIMVRHPEQDIYGGYYIPPQYTTDGRADFWIQPPIKKIGEPLVLDLEFLDQFGNVHQVRKVKFRPPQPKKKNVEPPMESIATIKDPVEREILGVLQSEVHRYKECGRRSGGLGSVILNCQGRKVPGVGTDCRTADSPEPQSIIPDPQNAKLESDNGTILIRYYQSLIGKDKQRFREVLIQRISRNNAYASIGYFFLYVGYRIEMLEDILKSAKADLKGDSGYGFSDLLRLLDGMLKYEYQDFDSQALDIVEQFVEGLGDEHIFRIPERIRAIRAFLLSKKVNS